MGTQKEPREYTVDEVRTMFLEKVWVYINYWASDGIPRQTCREGDIYFNGVCNLLEVKRA